MVFKINTDLLSPLLCLLYDTFEEPLNGKLFVKIVCEDERTFPSCLKQL